jgi:hypothetical protein
MPIALHHPFAQIVRKMAVQIATEKSLGLHGGDVRLAR